MAREESQSMNPPAEPTEAKRVNITVAGKAIKARSNGYQRAYRAGCGMKMAIIWVSREKRLQIFCL